MTSGKPTSTRFTESSRSSVANAAGTTASGPRPTLRSPPMASKAIVTLRLIETRFVRSRRSRALVTRRSLVLLGLFADFEVFTAAIKAVDADVVTAMRLTGGAVDGQRRPFQRVVRTAHAAPRRRLAVFLNCHLRLSSSDGRPLRSRRYLVIVPARPKRAPGYHPLPA